MADTFNTLMQALPPAQIALAEQLGDDKAANLTAIDEQLAALNSLLTDAGDRHTLYNSTRDAAIQAALAEIAVLEAGFDVSDPPNAPHSAVYGANFPSQGTVGTSGAFPYFTVTDDMHDFQIWNSAIIPVPVYTGTPGLNAIIDANEARMLLMGDNITNAFYGTSGEINSLGSAISIRAAERGSVESTADLYIVAYP